ncbi:hypothetical protein TsocGM_16890 [Tautonia sociabilis]|uniref:Uncharacterized protein n=2 Tax=Tautonia sociabilis TaxID=2080755 RepID=A0A432MH03_9BACT|nr:hypothetical protein [Tautonia sociabilis]RUL86094.1 hypothetical protein TsocGM_16890 [Tautonia sociabilis]
MMTFVFGYRDPACFLQALAPGRVMRLSNLLGDLREALAKAAPTDLPRNELDRLGLPEAHLAEGVVADDFLRRMRFSRSTGRDRPPTSRSEASRSGSVRRTGRPSG